MSVRYPTAGSCLSASAGDSNHLDFWVTDPLCPVGCPVSRWPRSATRTMRRSARPGAAGPTRTPGGSGCPGTAVARGPARRPGGRPPPWSSADCRRNRWPCIPADPAGRSRAQPGPGRRGVQDGSRLGAVEHVVVVHTPGALDHVAQAGRLAQVELCRVHRSRIQRDDDIVHRQVGVGSDPEQLVIDRTGAVAVEVEVGMVGQVHHRGASVPALSETRTLSALVSNVPTTISSPGKPWSPRGLVIVSVN